MGRVSELNTPYVAFYTADGFVPQEIVSAALHFPPWLQSPQTPPPRLPYPLAVYKICP